MKTDWKVDCSTDERGIALVLSLVTMMVVMLLGFGILVSTDGATRAEAGLKAQAGAFEAADGGIEYARVRIRQCLDGTGTGTCGTPHTPSQLLAAFGPLVGGATGLDAFPNTNGTAKGVTNTAFVTSNGSDLSPYSFQVFLTNDAAETGGTSSTTDNNSLLTLTSFASGPNGIGFAAVQADIGIISRLPPIPTLPATITAPGPNLTINLPNGNAFDMPNLGANCGMTIGVTSPTAWNSVNAQMTRPGNYDSCNPGGGSTLSGMATVKNFINDQGVSGVNPYANGGSFNSSPSPFPAGDTKLTSATYLSDLVTGIQSAANYVGPDTGSVNLGTAANPQIVVINGPFTMSGTTSGAGLLVVTGDLSWNGTPAYAGQILVIGTGGMNVAGGGGGGISFGGVLLANVNNPVMIGGVPYVGTGSITFNGGGNATWSYSSSEQNGVTARAYLTPYRVNFRQLPS